MTLRKVRADADCAAGQGGMRTPQVSSPIDSLLAACDSVLTFHLSLCADQLRTLAAALFESVAIDHTGVRAFGNGEHIIKGPKRRVNLYGPRAVSILRAR